MTRDEFCKYHWDYFLILEIVYAFQTNILNNMF